MKTERKKRAAADDSSGADLCEKNLDEMGTWTGQTRIETNERRTNLRTFLHVAVQQQVNAFLPLFSRRTTNPERFPLTNTQRQRASARGIRKLENRIFLLHRH